MKNAFSMTLLIYKLYFLITANLGRTKSVNTKQLT